MTNAFVGAVQALLVAVLGLLQVFGVVSLTDNQQGAILTVYGAAAALVLLVNTKYGKPARIRAAARAQGVL